MDWKRIIGAGIVFAIIAQVMHTIESFLTMNYYTMPDYFAVWSKVMMPTAGPPPMEFYIISIVFGIITGAIFAAVYSMFKDNVPGTGTKKGLYYGGILFLVVGIPFTSTMYLLINLPMMLLVWWSIFSLIIYLIGGIVIEKIVK
jgi:MFS family permease